MLYWRNFNVFPSKKSGFEKMNYHLGPFLVRIKFFSLLNWYNRRIADKISEN